MSTPTYNVMANVGKARHVVNFHDGQKTHQDGSPFFDIRTFSNKQKRDVFIQELRDRGYTTDGEFTDGKHLITTDQATALLVQARREKADFCLHVRIDTPIAGTDRYFPDGAATGLRLTREQAASVLRSTSEVLEERGARLPVRRVTNDLAFNRDIVYWIG